MLRVSLSPEAARQIVLDAAKSANCRFFTHVSHRHVGYEVGRRRDKDMADVDVIIEADEGATCVQVTSRMAPPPFLASNADPTSINEANIANVVEALRAAERRRDLNSE
jgi:hypothetical protein